MKTLGRLVRINDYGVIYTLHYSTDFIYERAKYVKKKTSTLKDEKKNTFALF